MKKQREKTLNQVLSQLLNYQFGVKENKKVVKRFRFLGLMAFLEQNGFYKLNNQQQKIMLSDLLDIKHIFLGGEEIIIIQKIK